MHVNGSPPEELKVTVAREVWTANLQSDDLDFEELEPSEQELLADHAEAHISAHLRWLEERGFRLLPPNATIRPTTEPEAMAMLQACKAFFDGQRRKGGLMGTAPRKLITGMN